MEVRVKTSEIEGELKKLGMPEQSIPEFIESIDKKVAEQGQPIDRIDFQPEYSSDETLTGLNCWIWWSLENVDELDGRT